MLSALIPAGRGQPAVPLARQLAHQRSVRPGPLVLGTALLKSPAPTADRDRHICYPRPLSRSVARSFLFRLALHVAMQVGPYLHRRLSFLGTSEDGGGVRRMASEDSERLHSDAPGGTGRLRSWKRPAAEALGTLPGSGASPPPSLSRWRRIRGSPAAYHSEGGSSRRRESLAARGPCAFGPRTRGTCPSSRE